MGFEIAQISPYVFLVMLLIVPGLACLLMCGINARDLWRGGVMFLAPVISIAIFSFPLYIAFLLQAALSSLSIIFFAILVVSISFIVFSLQGRQISFRFLKEGDALYYVLLGCLFMGIAYVTSDAIRMNTVFGADSLFHLARINKIIVHSAAGNFNPLTGTVIEIGKAYANNYYHLLIAVLATLTGLKAISIWYFFEYMNIVLLLALTYSLSKLFFSRHDSFILTCLVFGATFFLLDYRLEGTSVWMHATQYPYRYLFLNYPNAYVNKVLFLSMLFLFFSYRNGRLKYAAFAVLTCMLFFSAAGIHFIGAVLMFAGLSFFLLASPLLKEPFFATCIMGPSRTSSEDSMCDSRTQDTRPPSP